MLFRCMIVAAAVAWSPVASPAAARAAEIVEHGISSNAAFLSTLDGQGAFDLALTRGSRRLLNRWVRTCDHPLTAKANARLHAALPT